MNVSSPIPSNLTDATDRSKSGKGVASGHKLASGLVWVFIGLSIGFLLVLATQIIVQPRFSLDLGFIRTTGRTGLLVTLLPALVGLLGQLSSWRGWFWGAWLAAAYCSFWAVVFLGGLPQVWNVKRSFCLEGLNFCIVSPWVARLTVIALATPFLLAACWSVQQARRKGRARTSASRFTSMDCALRQRQ